jgi:methylglutaconyl-CoA hydratase
MSETLRIETDARGVATLTLTRGEKHNAMSAQMMAELTEAAATLGADRSIRVVVFASEGKSFSAGADLGWMCEQVAADRAGRIAEATRLANMLRALNEIPKPLIARVHGNAFGGGLGIISVSDVAIGASGAKFGFTETRLGIIPGTISPYVMARIGEGYARRVMMSARIFDAQEAREYGLLAKVVEPEALDDAIEAEVAPYLAAAPEAVARTKALVRSLGPLIDDSVMTATIERLVDTWETPEAREGLAAFFDKSKPSWIVDG